MTFAFASEASASDLLKEIAGPLRPGEKTACAIARAGRACGLKASRAKAYWYDEVLAPRASEVDAIRAAAGRPAPSRTGVAARQIGDGAKHELLEELRLMRARLDQLAALVASEADGERTLPRR